MSNQDNHRSDIFELGIDRLEVHLAEQAKLMYDYSQQLADARLELNRSKRRAEYFTAKVKQTIRAEPTQYTSLKLTEECLKELVVLQGKYQQVHRDLEKAQHQVDLLSGMVTSLTDRKHVLQVNAQMLSQGFFAEPHLPRASRQAVDELQTDRAFGPKKRHHD